MKDLASVLPGAVRVNRGKMSMRDLYYEASSLGARRVVIVTTWKGNPGRIMVYEPSGLVEARLEPLAAIYLSGVRLSRETPGFQRSFGVCRLGVRLEAPEPRLFGLADVLCRSFLADIVLEGEEEKVDVVASLRGLRDGGAEVVFRCASTGRPCGPALRVKRVIDYVAGGGSGGAGGPVEGGGRGSEESPGGGGLQPA